MDAVLGKHQGYCRSTLGISRLLEGGILCSWEPSRLFEWCFGTLSDYLKVVLSVLGNQEWLFEVCSGNISDYFKVVFGVLGIALPQRPPFT